MVPKQNEDLAIRFDAVTRQLKEIAAKKKIDLSRIRIRNREAEKYNKTYLFYN